MNLLTISQYAAKHTNGKKKMHRTQVYRDIKSGKLKTKKTGSVTFIIEK